MSTKHTPGPWEMKNGRIFMGAPDQLLIQYAGGHIATVEVLEGGRDQAAADARLIAAAPEMLEALKLSLGALSLDCPVTRDRIENVLAKAEGL